MGLWILLAVWLAGWLCIPHLLLLNKRPTATLAWVWAILLFPILGAALYLAIGSERINRRRMKRRRQFRGGKKMENVRADSGHASDLNDELDFPPDDKNLLKALAAITHLPVSTASRLQILRQAPAFYAALREDIQKAERDVHVESFIWRNDEIGREFLELLIAAAQRGVTVRLLLDEIGCIKLPFGYFKPLVKAGGQFSWCHTLSPLRSRYSFNLRNHRKLQIIDGRCAFVGGMNFGREYLGLNHALGDWDDLQVKIEGTVVESLQQIFAEDWYFATGRKEPLHLPALDPKTQEKAFTQVLLGGPDEEDHPMLRITLALIAAAKKRLWISTGYFVPGEILQAALQVASARGVDVRLLVSEKSEHPRLVKVGRSYYDALLRQGVRIYEYDKGIEHSKFVIIDSQWASIGSTNFDERSMRLNFELNVLAYHRETNKQLVHIFTEVIAQAREIHRAEFARRPFAERLLESTLRPLSPVL